MANLIQHLAAVSTGYKVFEDNQVLTKEPLNALVDYLDDQERLTRVALLGVGIIDGLRVSVNNDVVVLTKGVGVTTDGDLLRVPADLEYTRFRAYDETAPKYDRLYDGENMLKVFELVGEDVDTAATLGTFSAETGRKLEGMVAVLLMESFLKDQDLCTGGDCDNKGKDALSNVKLLLLDQDDIGLLMSKVGTFDDVSPSLTPAFADRVVLNAQINSAAALNNAYRTAANQTRDRLRKVLQSPVFSNTNTFGGEVFTSNPVPGWIVKLDTAVPDTGIQAYYDFLSDVADAYNAVGEALAGEISVLCPALSLFPKHLLLGVVGEFSSPPVRTGFYPSPLVRADAEAMARARFFANRVDALITSFTPALDTAAPITVTPSQTADRPLDDRAIPTYYTVNMNAPRPIHNAWSYARERRRLARHNYSANGPKYQAQGAAAAPLTARLDAFSFFRIEGHLGKPVTTAVSQIEARITQSSLPFTVRAVLLGGTRPQIRVKPPIRYTDLHRLHHLIRHDVALHLDDVITQSDRFKADVDLAVQDKVIDDRALGEELSIKGFAEETRQKVQASGTSAKTKLARRYSQYRAEPWQDEVKETMNQSAGMRLRLGEISRTELVSPVDSLVANKHALWAEWLDEIIGTKDATEDDKLLFANFIAQHPAADHAGGVARGGTFVLVYDSGGTVVADLALPYYWPEAAEPEPEQPPLAPPKSRPPIVIDKGWRVRKPTSRLVLDNINVRFDDFQRNYLQAVRDSVQIFTPVKDLTGGFVPTPPGFDDRVIKDPGLRVQLQDTMAKSERVQQIRRLLVTPSLDAVRRTQLEQMLKVADRDLGDSIKETTKVVTGAGIDVETEGAAAASVVANAFAHLTGTTASGVAKTMRTQASAAGVPAGAKTLVGAVLKGSGLKL
jgi:hypothetical protein